MIPYGRHYVDKNDFKSIKKVLNSNFLTQGPITKKFEEKISKFCKVKYSAAVSSASVALYISCRALNLKKDDIFWTVPNTYAATANSGFLCGSKVDFVDIDKNTNNICIKSLEKKLLWSKKKNKLPKVLITVHFAGLPCDQKNIWKLSKKYNFKIIEDASHSLGSKNLNNFTGNCKWSDLTVFSFHPVKIITTGEGGMITTNNRDLNNKIRMLINNGITKNPNLYKNKIKKKWYYEQHDISLNFRLSDISAALGLSQLKKINSFINKRNKIAKYYNSKLKDLDINLPIVNSKIRSSFHLYVIKVNPKLRNDLFDFLIKNKVDVNMHYLPLHLHPIYKEHNFKKGNFPMSELHSKSAISLPIYPSLKKKDMNKTIKLIREFYKKI